LLLGKVLFFDGIRLSLKDLIGALQKSTFVFEIIDLLVGVTEFELENLTKIRLHLA
jgi:hypothetical protein